MKFDTKFIKDNITFIDNTMTTIHDRISPIEYDIKKIKSRLNALELDNYEKGNKQKKKISVKIKL